MRRFCSKLDDSHLLRWLRWQNVQRARRRRKVVTKLFVTFCALGSHHQRTRRGVAQPASSESVRKCYRYLATWTPGHFLCVMSFHNVYKTNIQTLSKILHISGQSQSKWAVVSFRKLQTLKTSDNADILSNCCSPLVLCTFAEEKLLGFFYYRFQGIFFFP